MNTGIPQAVTPLDHFHAFFDACGAARTIRLGRILGAALARLRGEAGAATAVVGSEQQDALGVQWDSLEHEAAAVGALRATLAAFRAKVSDVLAGLLAFALTSAANIDDVSRNACTRAQRARAAILTKLHGLHHVALLSARNAREVLAVG